MHVGLLRRQVTLAQRFFGENAVQPVNENRTASYHNKANGVVDREERNRWVVRGCDCRRCRRRCCHCSSPLLPGLSCVWCVCTCCCRSYAKELGLLHPAVLKHYEDKRQKVTRKSWKKSSRVIYCCWAWVLCPSLTHLDLAAYDEQSMHNSPCLLWLHH